MRIVVLILVILLLPILASAVILLMAWPISAAAGWMWQIEPQWSLGLTLLTLLILAVAVHAAILLGTNPFFAVTRQGHTDDDEEDEEEEIDLWQEPCPCGRERVFAECCGRRAYRTQHR